MSDSALHRAASVCEVVVGVCALVTLVINVVWQQHFIVATWAFNTMCWVWIARTHRHRVELAELLRDAS